MERESVSVPSFRPPADDAQPLLAPSVVDESTDEVCEVKLQNLNQIFPELTTDIKNIINPHPTQSPILLSTFPSSHKELTENSEDNEEDPANYQSLPDDDNDSALYEFLASLGITRQLIDDAQVPWNALSKLYQKEFSCVSWLKWSSLDHAMEKNLQWPLLSPSDVGSGNQQKYDYRVRPQERSILLKTTWGLIKAYAVRGFVQGLETGLLKSVHYFIYVMLAYRLEELVITGRTQLEELQAIFEGSSQKGIDSLVRSLAGLDAQWLKLILAAPLILGVLQGIVKIRSARLVGMAERQKIADRIDLHLTRPGSFWRDVILEEIPLLSNFLSLGNQVQKLEPWIRWDGRLDHQSRKQAFELIRRTAREGKKITQLNALESLAKIAHGIGLKDLRRLQRAGHSPEALTDLLYIKSTALNDLETLSQREILEEKRSKSAKAVRQLVSFPRRLYASYFLWWLGQSTSWWTQRLPFALLKIMKLGLEVLFLQKIAASILEAIHCPDKPGFQFGNGYQDWASDYTAKCFTARVNFLRTLDTNESVAALLVEIPQYHLTELTTLNLQRKYLTAEEASQIIQAVLQQEAPLQTLDLSVNQISVLSEGMLSGLSQLTTLVLSSNQISVLSEGVFGGLSQLTTLDLSFSQISVLSDGVFSGLGQLTGLDLLGNQISVLSEGVLSGLSQLTILYLNNNRISVLSEGVFSELNQLTTLHLGGNQINALSDGAFSGLSQLTSLDLSGNQISILNEGVFRGLNQLTSLNLGDNQISALSDGAFSGLSQLTDLYLFYNKIRGLREGVLSGLSQLHVLNLYDNQISVLSEGVFRGLSQLKTLYLSMNHLNTSTILSILSSLAAGTLTELDISSNQISTLPQNFSTLLPVGLKSLSVGSNSFIPPVLTQEFMQYFPVQLTHLDLRFSLIVKITEGSFSDFSGLTALGLRNNRLSILSEGVFNGLSQLLVLDLFSNQISFLSEGVFSGLNQLTNLYLDNNLISVLSEGVFSGFSQLTFLDLVGNRISILSEGVFNGLSQLTTLRLSNNQISVLGEDVFSGLSQLTSLDLYYNRISVLSDVVFSGLGQLTGLNLLGNQISVLSEGVLSGLSQLTILYLNNNRISVLSEGVFSELNQLTTLHLGGNQINALSDGAFSGLSQLTGLSLAGNQLNDTAIQNLTQNFPYQLNYLDVHDNQIGNDGALALAKILPCTNLTYIDFSGNLVNDTALAIAAQQNALKKVCEDQRCHANLPATKSCGVNTNPSAAAQLTWGLFDNSASKVDETESDLLDHFYWPAPETPPFQLALALPSTTPESTSPVAVGAVILGVAGLSVLLYKNSLWMQAIVNIGSCFFQRCWSGRKTEEAKTTSPTHSVHSRYAFLPNLPTFSAQRVSTVTKTTDMTIH